MPTYLTKATREHEYEATADGEDRWVLARMAPFKYRVVRYATDPCNFPYCEFIWGPAAKSKGVVEISYAGGERQRLDEALQNGVLLALMNARNQDQAARLQSGLVQYESVQITSE